MFVSFLASIFAMAVVHGISESHLKERREIQDNSIKNGIHSDNSTLSLSPKDRLNLNSLWMYRKFCILQENTMKDTCLEVGRKMDDLSQERDRRDVAKKGPQKKGRQGAVKAAPRKKVVQDRRKGAPKKKVSQGRTKVTPKTKVRKGRQAPLNESIYSIKDQQGHDGRQASLNESIYSIKDQQGHDGHLQWFPMNSNFYPKLLRIRRGAVKAAPRKKVVQDRRKGAPKKKNNQGRKKVTPKAKVRKGRQAPLNESIYRIKDQQGQDGRQASLNESIYSIKDQQGHDGHLQWFPMNSNFYPKLLRIRRDGTNHGILKRSYVWGPNGPACQVVKGLKTSEVRCKTWPSRTTCKLYCVYGHAYNEGIERTTTCHFDKNQWSKPFEECEPFVECKLKLITPGSLSCVGNEIMKSPYCKVQCDDYEDKEATSTQTYECKADGTWKPKLPHCVDVTGRIRLVKPPQKKVHIEITYP